ncbi:MAG: dTDP-4-dehydrorhamnose reductase [Candidatus Latescibacterota bacterium]|nr:MAG: dTDP-4-dehydrorhamnose reductase [Candidatus Latescibacterota bacterium]
MKNKRKTIVIIGADGQLGMNLQHALSKHRLELLTYQQVDVLDRTQVEDALGRIRPEWVINTAALTHVDWCEENDVKAFQVNALGARHVGESCRANGARLVQISTDYVFDGKKGTPYREDDPTGPLNVYGITKLAGENYVRSAHPDHYIVRTSGLYGPYPCWGKGTNFVDTMLTLAAQKDVLHVVDDEVLTPTYTEDLAEQLRTLIEASPPPGVYHATNDGECSWYEFARAIFEHTGMSPRIEKTTAAEWKAVAKRPAYSVLGNEALRLAGIETMPHWKDALGRYLSKKLGS